MEKVIVQTNINADIQKVWSYYTEPQHITQWNHAFEDWCCPKVQNDVWVGGKFIARMEAKDGSEGLFFAGTYTDVEYGESMSYIIGDDRRFMVVFKNNSDNNIDVIVTFDCDREIPSEVQKKDWQNIMDNFKKYVESN